MDDLTILFWSLLLKNGQSSGKPDCAEFDSAFMKNGGAGVPTIGISSLKSIMGLFAAGTVTESYRVSLWLLITSFRWRKSSHLHTPAAFSNGMGLWMSTTYGILRHLVVSVTGEKVIKWDFGALKDGWDSIPGSGW